MDLEISAAVAGLGIVASFEDYLAPMFNSGALVKIVCRHRAGVGYLPGTSPLKWSSATSPENLVRRDLETQFLDLELVQA
jgi:hypothetical protein